MANGGIARPNQVPNSEPTNSLTSTALPIGLPIDFRKPSPESVATRTVFVLDGKASISRWISVGWHTPPHAKGTLHAPILGNHGVHSYHRSTKLRAKAGGDIIGERHVVRPGP